MRKQILIYTLGLAAAITGAAQTQRASAIGETNGVTGQGTTLTIPMFTGPATLGDSSIHQDGNGSIGIGGVPFAGARLGVSGNIDAAGDVTANNFVARGKITVGDISAKTLTLSGNFTANSVSASQYKIGSNLVLNAAGANTMVGFAAGASNTGQNNTIFGYTANNWGIGNDNAMFGTEAGYYGAGNENSYFGRGAGKTTFTNNRATLIGAGAGTADGTYNATAIGAHAFAGASDTLVLGSVNGTNGATSEPNVGIGTTTPHSKLHVATGDIYISLAGRGLILKSYTGNSCTQVMVDDAHHLYVSGVPCPGGN